jgi:hypothetical protein
VAEPVISLQFRDKTAMIIPSTGEICQRIEDSQRKAKKKPDIPTKALANTSPKPIQAGRSAFRA